jgi:hypothetical protein
MNRASLVRLARCQLCPDSDQIPQATKWRDVPKAEVADANCLQRKNRPGGGRAINGPGREVGHRAYSSDLLLWWRAMQDSGDLTRFVGAHHFLYFMFSEAQSVR